MEQKLASSPLHAHLFPMLWFVLIPEPRENCFHLPGEIQSGKCSNTFEGCLFSAQKEKSFSFYCTFISIHVRCANTVLIQGGCAQRNQRSLWNVSIGGEKLLKRSQAANRMTQIDISGVQCLTEAFRSIRSDPISRIFPLRYYRAI